MFLRRLKVFDFKNNKYFVPNGKFNTWSPTASIQIPNCTLYCYLRMHEMCDFDKVHNTLIRASGGFGNAKTWYDTTTLPKGKELKEGAIVVCDGNYGHVFIAEKVYDSTHADVSTESNYSDNKNLRDWHFFNVRENVELVVGKSPFAGIGPVIGFIYPPINDVRVSRFAGLHQIEITEEYVNVRTAPNGDIVNIGCYCPTGFFNVKDVNFDGKYTWYKLDEGHWIREGEWLKDYPVEDDKLAQIKEHAQKILELCK